MFEEYDASNVIARRTPDPEKAFPLVKPEKPGESFDIKWELKLEYVRKRNVQRGFWAKQLNIVVKLVGINSLSYEKIFS